MLQAEVNDGDFLPNAFLPLQQPSSSSSSAEFVTLAVRGAQAKVGIFSAHLSCFARNRRVSSELGFFTTYSQTTQFFHAHGRGGESARQTSLVSSPRSLLRITRSKGDQESAQSSSEGKVYSQRPCLSPDRPAPEEARASSEQLYTACRNSPLVSGSVVSCLREVSVHRTGTLRCFIATRERQEAHKWIASRGRFRVGCWYFGCTDGSCR